jgi:predicted dehydrogenase
VGPIFDQAAAEYHLDSFEQMLEKEKVEVLVVTTVDATHDQFIIPALRRGIKVLTEKPMTTDVEKSKAILRAVKETGNHLTVTFVS